MKRFRFLLLVITFYFCFIQFAHAKARFMELEELVAESDVIAAIEVIKSEKLGELFDKDLPKKGSFGYAQKNEFKFTEFIKVQKENAIDAKKNQILWAAESFICANVSYAKGKYLVFLRNVGENEWIILNFQFGGLPIDEKGNVARFGFYRQDADSKIIDFNKAKEAVDLKEAKEMLLKTIKESGTSKINSSSTSACPSCGLKKDVVPIIYGLPGTELMEKEKRGEVKLGGCEIFPNAPQWYCNACLHNW